MFLMAVVAVTCVANGASAQAAITSIANDTKQLTYGFRVNTLFGVLTNQNGIVFTANPLGSVNRLYYVPMSADKEGQVRRISQENVAEGTGFGGIAGFRISPNDGWVVFYGAQTTYVGAPTVIFSVSPTGGAIEKISGVVPQSNSVNTGSIIFQPNSRWVSWYSSVRPASSGYAQDIFSNVQSGGSHRRISPDLRQNSTLVLTKRSVRSECDGLYPNEGQIILANPGNAGVDDPLNLYIAAWDGSSLIQMSPAAGNVARFTGLSSSNCGRWSPDRKYVVYTADEIVVDQKDLFSFNVDTKVRKKINIATAAGNDVTSSMFKITPDSKNVVYTSRDAGTGDISLYSIDIAGATNVKLNGLLSSSSNFKISSDSKWVIYTVTVTGTPNSLELYASQIGVSGHKIKISPNTVASTTGVVSGAFDYAYPSGLNSSNFVLFKTTTNIDGTQDLYAAALPKVDAATGSNGATIVKLSSGMLTPGVPGSFNSNSGYQLSSDSKWVIFRGRITAFPNPAVPGSVTQYSVFKVSLDGSKAQALLAPKSFSSVFQTAANFQVSAYGPGYVVTQVTDTAVLQPDRMWSTTLTEATEAYVDLTPVRADGLVFTSGSMSSWRIHTNGNQVMYQMSFPSSMSTRYGFWSISIKGGDLVKISFDGQDPLTQGPASSLAGTTILKNGDILYMGDRILNGVNDYIRNRSPASYLVPAVVLLVACMLF